MKATARRLNGRDRHEVEIRDFRFATGGPTGDDAVEATPTPQELLAASLAACSTLTLETYAKRKGWEIGEVVVEVDYEAAQRGSPARCAMVVRLADNVPEEQRRRLMAVAAKSPVHRTLEGETMFDERLAVTLPDPGAANGRPTSAPSGRQGLLGLFRPTSRRVA